MNVRKALVLSVVFGCLSAPVSAAQLEWSRTVRSGIVDTSAVVADVDGKDGKEIVLCSTGGSVLVWDAEGNELWCYDIGDMITVPPAVADVDGRAGLEICALDNGGKLVCLSAKGKLLWDHQLPAGIGWGTTTVVARDIDRDGAVEVLAADSGGHVVCLDRRGNVKWLYGCPSPVNSPLAVADLDARGGDEILFGSDDGYLRCLSSNGEPRWSFQSRSAVRSGPVVVDVDGKSGPEVLAGSQDGILHALSADGSLLWQFNCGAEIDSCISVADIDADGHQDVVLGNLRGDLLRLTAEGKESWQYDVKMRSRRSATLADIDGDGSIEILLGNYSGYLYVLTVTGDLQERILLGGSMNAAPAVGDLNGDGRLEAVCPITSGEVRCYSWYTTASQQTVLALWPMYRYDAAQTASPSNAERTPETVTARADYGQLLVSTNEYRLEVSNPARKKLRVEQTIRVRGAPAVWRRVTESAEPHITASLTYEIDGRAARDIKFGYTVSEQGTKKALCRGGDSFYVVPFANDLALMRHLVGTLRTTGKIDENSAEYFARQRDCFAHRLRQLEESVARASSLDDEEFSKLKGAVASSLEELQRLDALLRIAESAYQRAGSQLVVWAANPWAPFRGIDDLPDDLPEAATFELDVYRSEYASAAFNVANMSPEPVTVRVTMEDMGEASGAESTLNPYRYFTLHEVAAVPTVRGNYSADALPRLNQGRLVTLPPWSARQVWTIFCAGDLEPGTYTTVLVLTSLELEPRTTRCEISARVRPIALPTPSPLRFCNWGYVYSSVIRDFEEEARDDLVSHGTNVFVITTYHTPAARFDSTGRLVGEIDYAKHDFIVNLYKDHGLLMFFNYQAVLKGRDGDAYMSPAWKKAYAAWLTQWVEHLREIGVGYDGFALYPVDEPGLHDTGRNLIDRFIEIAKLTREVDPRIQIYTDPVGGARLEHLKEMAPYVDIWCPNRNGIVLARNDARLDFLLSTGKPVWTYECEGSAKEQPPLVYYRGQAWLAWHHGLTGIGFWSYCTSRFDPWFRPVGERANDYLLIYQGDGIVTSKRWEACRDGVEDYGALWELRRVVKLATEQGVNPDLVNRAARLIETAAENVAEWSGGAHRAAYLRDPVAVADRDWRILRNYRKQIADLTEQVRAELSAK